MNDAFIEWVNNLGNHGISRTVKADSFLAVSNTALYPVVCNSRLVGANAQNALNADSQYIQYRSMGKTSDAQALLGQNPATALAMILTLAQQQSGFNPSDPAQIGNMQGFSRYVNQLFQCPVLTNEINDQVNCTYGSDWGSTIDSILSYYVGIEPCDLNTMRDSLWSIARAAASCPNTNETQNLFVQNAMNIDTGYKIYMYKTIVQMVEEQHKGSGKNAPTYTADRTYFVLYRVVFHLNFNDLASYSAFLMAQTDASLHSWLDENSAPINNQTVNWTCNFC